MSDTKIEWTDATWNPVRGCSRVSEGCRNCYAEHQALRITRFDRGHGKPEGTGAYDGLVTMTSQGPKWTGQIRLVHDKLEDPLHWKKPRLVFVNSMSDLWHENVPDEFIDQVFGVMGACDDQQRGHTFQILTKRAERMRSYMRERGHKAWNSRRLGPDAYPPRNVQLGVSVEDQSTADKRIIELLRTPAAVRFISAEPLLAELQLWRLKKLDFEEATEGAEVYPLRGLYAVPDCDWNGPRLDWVIVGGESGRGSRLMKAEWARSLRDQCQDAGVPFFFKQWGGADKKEAGRLLDGREWNEFPGLALRVTAQSNCDGVAESPLDGRNGIADWTKAGTGVNSPTSPAPISREALTEFAGSNPAAVAPPTKPPPSARKKPSSKKLELEVAAFNRRFAVGDEVDYYEVMESGECKRYRTRTPAQILSDHTAVVWLEGKAGCVCCSHCFMPPGVAA